MNYDTIHISEKEQTLTELCKKGNKQAFKEIYYMYNKAMYNVCVRMLNNKEEAEDILQESFISAFKNIQQYKGNASFGSWLKRIVINRCLDSLSARKQIFVHLNEKEIAEEKDDEETEEDFSITEIKNAMVELPDGYRVIINLYLFEDFTHRMIAEKLKVSEGTSKSQYSRAKKKLAQLILKNKRSHAG